jgi:hypothetical protein
MPQFNAMNFLLFRAIADRNLDTPQADRLALAVSLMNMGLMQSVVLTSLLAQSSDGQGSSTTGVSVRGRRARSLAAPTPAAKVKVPSVRHMSDPKKIDEHLHEHRLRTRIHREAIAEIKSPRVLRQWPEADEDVDEGAEVNVLLLIPEEARHGSAEPRARK